MTRVWTSSIRQSNCTPRREVWEREAPRIPCPVIPSGMERQNNKATPGIIE